MENSWTLRFLKKSGMSKPELLGIYKNVLRPSAEYSSVIYNSLIPDYVSNKLESVQRQALKIIYGWDYDLKKLFEQGAIETLKERREAATLRFALASSKSERFSNKWYKQTPLTEREVRSSTRNKYVEPACRTERGRNNPITVMARRLNEEYRANLANS